MLRQKYAEKADYSIEKISQIISDNNARGQKEKEKRREGGRGDDGRPISFPEKRYDQMDNYKKNDKGTRESWESQAGRKKAARGKGGANISP